MVTTPLVAATAPPASERLVALDAFRGLTIAGMILVNNPGSWRHIYGPLGHAQWHGCTPTDLVFPFFLFIVGVALTFSLRRRTAVTPDRSAVWIQIVRRSVLIFLLGLFMAAFPDFRLLNKVRAGTTEASWVLVALSLFRLALPYILAITGIAMVTSAGARQAAPHTSAGGVRRISGWALLALALAAFVFDFAYFRETGLRIPGVLQRIALCYFFAALVVLLCRVRTQVVLSVGLLLGYWGVVTWVSPPTGFTAQVEGAEGLLHEWLDSQFLAGHLYRDRPDPEGLLSTLPAIVTVLCGALTGRWLQTTRDTTSKLVGLFVAANLLLLVGLWWGLSFPINKKIWTSSYVLLTAGLALHFLAMGIWLVDLRGRRAWTWPFVVFGSNAIVVYVASSVVAKILGGVRLADNQTSLKAWLYDHFFANWAGPLNGSLLFAVAYVAVWLLPMIVLYRRRILIRV